MTLNEYNEKGYIYPDEVLVVYATSVLGRIAQYQGKSEQYRERLGLIPGDTVNSCWLCKCVKCKDCPAYAPASTLDASDRSYGYIGGDGFCRSGGNYKLRFDFGVEPHGLSGVHDVRTHRTKSTDIKKPGNRLLLLRLRAKFKEIMTEIDRRKQEELSQPEGLLSATGEGAGGGRYAD